ncbi:MAG: flagellar basal body rod protein FlgB [Acidobacteriota bacterium]
MKITDPVMQRLGAFLDYAARKQEAISSNLANAETPGYQAKDVRFEEFLREEAASAQLTRTKPRHLPGRPRLARSAAVETRAGDSLGNDANDVDLDQEMTALAQNVVRFSIAARLLQMKGQLLKSSIKEGKI